MKLVRFSIPGTSGVKAGVLVDRRVRELVRDIFPPHDFSGDVFELEKVQLEPPAQPTKIVAVGINYRDHALEFGHQLPEEPMIFMKPSTAVIGPGKNIIRPKMSALVHYEAELGVVIGRTARQVSPERSLDHVLGFTCLNDITARDLQRKDGQWIRAKGFDTFCPIGPVVETELDTSDLGIEAWLNGTQVQGSRTSNLVFGVPTLVSFISRIMTLNPGDIIATGTPSGVGELKAGDSIEIRIQGIGALVNGVAEEE